MEQWAGSIEVTGEVWQVFATLDIDGTSVESFQVKRGSYAYEWRAGQCIPLHCPYLLPAMWLIIAELGQVEFCNGE